MHYADNNDAEVEARIKYILTELSTIQTANSKDANFVGYISGVPNGKAMWLKMKNGDKQSTEWLLFLGTISISFMRACAMLMCMQASEAKTMF